MFGLKSYHTIEQTQTHHCLCRLAHDRSLKNFPRSRENRSDYYNDKAENMPKCFYTLGHVLYANMILSYIEVKASFGFSGI
jgi:hypothetical protein